MRSARQFKVPRSKFKAAQKLRNEATARNRRGEREKGSWGAIFCETNPLRSARRFKVSGSRFKVGQFGESAYSRNPKTEGPRSERSPKAEKRRKRLDLRCLRDFYQTNPIYIPFPFLPLCSPLEITKRTHSLGAPVQGFGFKVSRPERRRRRQAIFYETNPCAGRAGSTFRVQSSRLWGKLRNEAISGGLNG